MPVLTATLRAFREAFPTVGVRLYSGVMGAVVDLVLRGQVDLAIAGSTLVRHDALVARPLGGPRLGPTAHPGHPLPQAAGPVPLAPPARPSPHTHTTPPRHTPRRHPTSHP